ncbi:MAG: 16S rRNA (uracil(1498)-N(3))-methyltransferase [Candidatus Scalindua rubra]|uniref:Ribosomal RNA small subunit methyltransferase E n=1 Tax=Candidatus Scalindua brodae TaxID=237368 RepID=A0A0B0EIW6_9BACT|nr:MAG: RNA methyltransferase YggJ [Candidatus Scalindua brodae]MBZ0110263.1 16S rRNA (uracil(1498)-N(3))-methyltransferase [Candidatus Scalindua rubra]TWU35468.1 16S ribosomal RNA methyltransferase RsmE [Candidatus Brocadiaceae bacterium S225]
MNLIILSKNDFIEDTGPVHIRDHRLEHIRDVNKSSVGDELRVGLVNGNIGCGRITSIEKDKIEMDVTLDREPPAPLQLTLMFSMVRPRVFKRVITQASAMGIKKIIVVNSYRVEKSFWKSPVLEEKNLNRYLITGLEQGQDTIVPKVLIRPLFKPFVEDELPDMIKDTMPFVAHPYASELCPYNVGRPVTLAVGPEGGFIPYEINKLIECGFNAVHMGERTLHVESAISGLIGRLM